MNKIIITGASSGIGAAFVKQLAAEGNSLVLVARRADKLEKLARSLTRKNDIEVDILTCDLSDHEGPDGVLAAIEDKGWKISGLINNAGFGQRGAFADQPLNRYLDMIQVNVTALVALSHKLVPKLKEGRNPFIINVASTAAFQAGPGMAVYFATKAFVLSFSEALHEELSSMNITVSALCPGPTQTEFAAASDMESALLFKAGIMSSETVARKSLKDRSKAIVIPGMLNRLSVDSTKFTPRCISRKIADRLVN